MLLLWRMTATALLTLSLGLPAYADTLRIAIPADPGYIRADPDRQSLPTTGQICAR